MGGLLPTVSDPSNNSWVIGRLWNLSQKWQANICKHGCRFRKIAHCPDARTAAAAACLCLCLCLSLSLSLTPYLFTSKPYSTLSLPSNPLSSLQNVCFISFYCINVPLHVFFSLFSTLPPIFSPLQPVFISKRWPLYAFHSQMKFLTTFLYFSLPLLPLGPIFHLFFTLWT